MTYRAATYCRYSSDNQNELSSEDQLRICKEYAAKNDIIVLPEHCYKDDAISGASAVNRRGLQALLQAARYKPKPFDIVLVESTSRASRDVGDTFTNRRELDYLGIPTIWVQEGFKSTDENADELLLMHSGHNQATRKKISRDTHRGLSSQKRRGYSAGGSCYGYRTIRTAGPNAKTLNVIFEVNEDEAKVVIYIFEMAAEGISLKRICRRLAVEGIQPPRPKDGWLRRGRHAGWHPSFIAVMLRNERYIGQDVWNRTRWIKSPEGNRVQRPRPESEWIRMPSPRIVSDELWNRVQEKLAWKTEHYGRRGGGRRGLYHGAASTNHLLSGLLRCSECGGNLTVNGRYHNRQGHKTCYYGCSNYANRRSCPNDLREREDLIEEALLKAMQEKVLRDEILDAMLDEAEKELKVEQSRVTSHLDQDREREAALKGELRNLYAVIAKDGDYEMLKEEIAERENELKIIRERVLTAGRDEVNLTAFRAAVKRKFMDVGDLLRQGLASDPDIAKQFVNENLGVITMTPTLGRDGRRHYVGSTKFLVGSVGSDGLVYCGGWI